MSDTTVRITKETQHKLKVMSAIQNTTPNKIISDLVNNAIEEDEILKQIFKQEDQQEEK